MNDISKVLLGYSKSEIRSSLYYAARYFKQSSIMNDYEKDIFVDVEDSQPSNRITQLTNSIISFIEEREGSSANSWSDDVAYGILSELAQIESGLVGDLSHEDLERAKKVVDGW